MLTSFFALFLLLATSATPLPLCDQRPTHIDPPWVDGRRFCLEQVIREDTPADFTALAVGTDGTLYAARPRAGQIIALTDSSGDGLPDAPRVLLEGLTLPSALATAGDTLYIAGGPHLYRWQDGELTVLVDDLPAGTGFWTGGLAVGPDERLYIGVGANCDFCLPDSGRGVIYSFAPDGSDRQIVAEGLRHPAGLAFLNGALWVTDSARDGLFDTPNLDELNRVEPGAHFGWPHCVGAASTPDLPGDLDCDTATPPVMTFPTASQPVGLAAYTSTTLPDLTNTLLVAWGGTFRTIDLRGFAVLVVDVEQQRYEAIIPQEAGTTFGFSVAEMNYRTSGFWPRHPLGIAVSPEGWVYLSVSGGQILALRPLA